MEPIGLYSASISEGIEVLKISYGIEDYVHFRWFDEGGNRTKVIKSKVIYDEDGAFFKTRGISVPFNEVIAINGGETS